MDFCRGKIATIDCDLAITEVKYGVDQNNRRYSEQHTNTASKLSKFQFNWIEDKIRKWLRLDLFTRKKFCLSLSVPSKWMERMRWQE